MAKCYRAWISNPSKDEVAGSNPGAVQKKNKKNYIRETPRSHDLGVARCPYSVRS